MSRTTATVRERRTNDRLSGALGLGGQGQRVLSSTDADTVAWRGFAEEDGVWEKVFHGDDGTSSAGILHLEAGSRVRPHFHVSAAHHLWVLSGSCEIAPSDRILGPGSYVFVPRKSMHAIAASAGTDCTMFFVDVQQAEPAWSLR